MKHSPSLPVFRRFGTSSLLLSLCLACGALAQEPTATPAAPTALLPYQNKALSPQQRTDDLLGRLTLEEKIKLLGGWEFYTMPIERLGVPAFVMSDGPQGVRNYGNACAFPCGAALASTWDPALAKLNGEQLGLEARARGVHYLLGPGMNIARVAVNGRNFEYFGEDPFLASLIATGYVQGVQSKGVIATVKHFAGNNQEWMRGSVDTKISERALHEIYFPAFKRCITEGGAWAVMDAYNRLNGSYCTDNSFLQKEILRDSWGFKGTLMSDWGASHSVTNVQNGLDLEMPNAKNLSEAAVKAALASGTVSQAALDAAVSHNLFTEFSMGFFDRPQKDASIPVNSPEARKAALEIARAGVVLLKNDKQTLPLDAAKIRSIAVYGDYAANTPISGGGSGHIVPFHQVNYLEGIRAAAGDQVTVTYHEQPKADPAIFKSLACARVNAGGEAGLRFTAKLKSKPAESGTLPLTGVETAIDYAWSDEARPFAIPAGTEATLTWEGVLVTPEDGDWELVTQSSSSARYFPKPDIRIGKTPPQFTGNAEPQWEKGDGIHLVKGEPVPVSIRWQLAARGKQTLKVGLRPVAIDAAGAKEADVAIICTGRFAGESHDSFFELPLAQRRLIDAVCAANPRTVIVNTSGAGVDLAHVSKEAAALMQAWFLGQEAGTAVGEVLFGKVNPSGRLPMTFDRELADNAAFANYPGVLAAEKNQPPQVEYKEGIFVGYRGYDKTGKAPLYPFGYGLSYTQFKFADLKVTKAGDGAKITLKVTNSGARDGAEVVQVYVGQPKAQVERPVRELKGFAKVALKPGETRQVTIDLPRDAFAYWSPEKKGWTVDPGKFVVEAGASSRDIRLKQAVEIGK